MLTRPPWSTLFPYTTLFRSLAAALVYAQIVFGALLTHAGRLDLHLAGAVPVFALVPIVTAQLRRTGDGVAARSEEHTSELQSLRHLVCRLLLEKKKEINPYQ